MPSPYVLFLLCVAATRTEAYRLLLKCEGCSPQRVYPVLASCFSSVAGRGTLQSVHVHARRIFDDQFTFHIGMHTAPEAGVRSAAAQGEKRGGGYAMAYVHGDSILDTSMRAAREVNSRVQKLVSVGPA